MYTIRERQRNRGEMTKNDVLRIVYKRQSSYFVNRFFAACCTQDLRRGSGLVDEHEVFVRQKKLSATRKLTTNNEQCTATRSSRFCQQYFIRRKNNFFPYSSCSRIVYGGIHNFLFFCPVKGCLPILFSYKYGPSFLFFINICC